MVNPKTSERTSPVETSPPRPWWHRLRRVPTFILGPYLGVTLLLGIFQRSLLYHPMRAAEIRTADTGLPASEVSDVTIRAGDGTALHGWLARTGDEDFSQADVRRSVRESDAPVVIYFQGNAGNRLENAAIVRDLVEVGAHVLYVDYRGFGLNKGSPSEAALVGDGRAVWDFAVKHLGIAPRRIFLFGESLGGGVATAVAHGLCGEGVSPAGLILGSTFSSVRSVAQDLYPFIPVRWMLLDSFLSSERVTAITCPLLQFHGTNDSIVPVEIGRELFEAMPAASALGIEKRYVEIPGGEHYDIPTAVFRDELSRFLHRVSAPELRRAD